MSTKEYNEYKKSLEKKVTVNKLLKLISGGELLVIGRNSDDGNYYSPSVENSTWLWQGKCTQWFEEENIQKDAVGEREVRFVSTIPSEERTYLRILI